MLEVDVGIAKLVEDLSKTAASGLPLHEYQVLCALRTSPFQQALTKRVGNGERVDSIVRVYYSKNAGVIEVLARIADERPVRHKARRSGVLVTIHSRTFECLSVIEDFTEPSELGPEGVTFLPLVMSLPSAVEACGVSTADSTLIMLQERRAAFAEELVADLGDGAIVAASNCQTCNISSVQTAYSTTIPSTNNGRDNDEKGDTRTDPGQQECSTDTNDDT